VDESDNQTGKHDQRNTFKDAVFSRLCITVCASTLLVSARAFLRMVSLSMTLLFCPRKNRQTG
jgi:hypothetical protein